MCYFSHGSCMCRVVDLELKPRDRRCRPLPMAQIAWAAGAEPMIGKMRSRSRCDRFNEPHAATQSADFSDDCLRDCNLLVKLEVRR